MFIALKVFSLMKIPIKITWKTNMVRKFLIYVYRVFRKLIHFAFFFPDRSKKQERWNISFDWSLAVSFVTNMCRNDDLSLTMNRVGCLLSGSGLPDQI